MTILRYLRRCVEECLYIAIKYTINLANFNPCPVVFHELVWMKHIRTKLTPPFNLYRLFN